MFCTFYQNNSGGYFIQNEDVDGYVIIEGDTLDEILDSAEEIFESYREYCECCGERWNDYLVDEDDLTDVPSIYGRSVYEYHYGFNCDLKAIIYYKNGKRENILI